MAGDSADGDSRVNCKFCNKPAVNKIVKCVVCDASMHRHCCDKRKIEININNTANCCLTTTAVESRYDSGELDGKVVPMQDGFADQASSRSVSELLLEVSFLKTLLEEKQKIIEDKCIIINDKQYIVDLQRAEIESLRSVVNGRVSFPLCSNVVDDVIEPLHQHGNNKIPVMVKPKQCKTSDASGVNSVSDRLDGETLNYQPGQTVYDKTAEDVNDITAAKVSTKLSLRAADVNKRKSGDKCVTVAASGRTKTTPRNVLPRSKRSSGITGTGQSRPNVKTVPKKAFVYLSRFAPDTSADSVREIIREYCEEAECEPVKSKYPQHYSSFKVCVDAVNKNVAMDPTKWPAGVFINEFFRAGGRSDSGSPN